MSNHNQRRPSAPPVPPVPETASEIAKENPEETKRQVSEMLNAPAIKREPVLAVGRIVLYVLKETEDLSGQIRPAIVTRVWNPTCAQLTVFPDGSNDFLVKDEVISILPPGTAIIGSRKPVEYLLQFAVSSPVLDQEHKAPGSFHFPEID